MNNTIKIVYLELVKAILCVLIAVSLVTYLNNRNKPATANSRSEAKTYITQTYDGTTTRTTTTRLMEGK